MMELAQTMMTMLMMTMAVELLAAAASSQNQQLFHGCATHATGHMLAAASRPKCGSEPDAHRRL
jgi:hypothetical protein